MTGDITRNIENITAQQIAKIFDIVQHVMKFCDVNIDEVTVHHRPGGLIAGLRYVTVCVHDTDYGWTGAISKYGTIIDMEGQFGSGMRAYQRGEDYTEQNESA